MPPFLDDGDVVLHQGDALEVLRELPTAAFDAVMTDPPYSSGGMFRSDRTADPLKKYRGWSQNGDGTSREPTAEYASFGGDNRDQRAFMLWMSFWTRETLRVTRPGGSLFLFTDWRQLPAMSDGIQLGGWTWRGIVVWDKGVARPQAGRFRNHLEYVLWASNGPLHDRDDKVYPSSLIAVPTVPTGDRVHVTEKPVALLSHLLAVVGTGRLHILDPFAGSGSTLVAARNGGHAATGIELDPSHCRTAAARLGQLSLLGGAA